MEKKASSATLDHLLNDPQSFTWAELKEAHDKTALLIPLDDEQANRYDRFYSASARQLVTALLLHVRNEQKGPDHAGANENSV